jgi:hypothetical protein
MVPETLSEIQKASKLLFTADIGSRKTEQTQRNEK